ncbi:MAG: SurA N-terminal domain-containing protein [Azoarcus sp.]|jgi:peptidyl-prolyl cis-trans isomerase D|nr:SurA N-terminal domain-containing protein [Azoarcus sp.]
MFEAIRSNKRIAQVILAVLIIPFAAFGLDAYFGDGPGGGEVATVGGSAISRNEFERALEEQRNRLRQQFGDEATPAMLNSGELSQAVLDQLVVRRALALYSKDMRLSVSGGRLQQELARIEGFQENGQFSMERYKLLLSRQGMNPAFFEEQLSQDLLIQQLMDSIGSSSPVARQTARRLLSAQLEERVVREMRFPVAPHLANIKIDEAAIQKYYDDNSARFELPERIKTEYLVLSEEALQGKAEVSEADIEQAYRDWPGERQVRHILIEADADADAAAVEAAKKEAEGIAEALRKEPSSFPALAKEKSQDSGSSEAGGDLGFIEHDGAMEPAFEEAAFALKQDEISDPVRTRYGFHVIQVTAVRKQPLADARDEIVARLRKQASGQGFDAQATKFSEMVFNEAPDSLQPAAEAFGLEIQRTDWIDRGSDKLGEFRNESLIADLFGDDALNQRHNTKAIDVAPNTLVAARVLEHEAARRLPLEEVRGQIEAQLRREEAMRLARTEGNAALEALDRGESVDHAWSTSRAIQRIKPDLPPRGARVVFAAPLKQLPTRVAAELPDDAYVIYQVDSVERPSIDDDDPRIATLAGQYGLLLGNSDFEAFLASLRGRYKVVAKPLASQAAAE